MCFNIQGGCNFTYHRALLFCKGFQGLSLKYFKYIDFGLSSELIDSNHFRLRSLSEFKSNRLYLWYPLEYLYSVIDDSSKIKELS